MFGGAVTSTNQVLASTKHSNSIPVAVLNIVELLVSRGDLTSNLALNRRSKATSRYTKSCSE